MANSLHPAAGKTRRCDANRAKNINQHNLLPRCIAVYHCSPLDCSYFLGATRTYTSCWKLHDSFWSQVSKCGLTLSVVDYVSEWMAALADDRFMRREIKRLLRRWRHVTVKNICRISRIFVVRFLLNFGFKSRVKSTLLKNNQVKTTIMDDFARGSKNRGLL